MTMDQVLGDASGLIEAGVFVVLAAVALVSAVAVVSRRNPIAAVAWLVVHFVATACLYVLLDSQFLAAVQVLVYAGAILVLFLFVIMLLSADRQDPGAASGLGRKVLVAALGLVLLTAFSRLVVDPPAVAPEPAAVEADASEDTVESLAGALFTRHVVAFELSSLPLLAAMAGVMVYTTRRVVTALSPRGDAALEPTEGTRP